MLMETVIEFDLGMFNFVRELYEAYDAVDQSVWADAFQKDGIPSLITACIIREVRRARGCLRFLRGRTTIPFTAHAQYLPR